MKRNKSEEFIKLQTWGETILNCMNASEYDKDLIDIFNQCVERGRLIIMRVFIHDLNEMALAWGEETGGLMKLNRILMEKFGEDLMSGMAKRMAGVLKRGKIRNDDEFIRVNEWIDHLLYDKDNPDAEQQIEQYNRMLIDYQERAARRLGKVRNRGS